MPGTSQLLKSLPNPPKLTEIDVLPFIAESVICTDGDGRIILFNRAAERSFGYPAVDVLGENIGMLLPERHRAQHAVHMRAFGLEDGVSSRLMGAQREVWGLRKTGEEFAAEATVSRHSLNGRTILTVVHRDITERRELEKQLEAISHELDHRIKNVLSVVSALISLTARNVLNVTEFRDSLQARLHSLAATQIFLARGKGKNFDLNSLLKDELAHYRSSNGENIRIEGTTVALRTSSVQPLALVFHELATNSAKYGAISKPGGYVTVVSEITSAAIGRQFVIEWRETGGPLVKAPDRAGFGSILIQQMIERVFHGAVAFDYQPKGFVCRMAMPADRLVETEGEDLVTNPS